MEPKLWHRLPRETDTQFAYYKVFLEWAYPDGPNGKYRPRDLGAIASEIGVSTNLLHQHSAGASWFARASAYDSELEQARFDKTLTAIKRFRVRTEKSMDTWAVILEKETTKLLQRANDPEVPCMTVRELSAVQEMILKQQAILAGLDPGEDIPGLRVEDMSDDDLSLADQLAKKYGASPDQRH